MLLASTGLCLILPDLNVLSKQVGGQRDVKRLKHHSPGSSCALSWVLRLPCSPDTRGERS